MKNERTQRQTERETDHVTEHETEHGTGRGTESGMEQGTEPGMKQETEPGTEIFDADAAGGAIGLAAETKAADLVAENERLKGELRLMTAREELTGRLMAARARSPELLFEASRSRLTFDDEGKLAGAEELIANLRDRFPEQFAAEAEPATRQPVQAPSINSGAGRSMGRMPLTKEQLARMKPREIAGLDWNEVREVLGESSGKRERFSRG